MSKSEEETEETDISIEVDNTQEDTIMLQPGQSRRPFYGIIVGVIAMYWSVSISMVFLNKQVLSGTFGDEDLTIFSAWYQSSVAVGCILCFGYSFMKCGLISRMPKLEPSQLLSRNMILLSISSVCTLTFNNLMLKHIGVAFYQVARSFTIIFTIVLSSVVLRRGLTWRAIAACGLVVSGFFIGIDQEDVSGTLSVFGIIYGLLASLSAAICGILFKKVEPLLENDSLKLAYYNNLNSMILFIPLLSSSGQLTSVFQSEFKYNPKFWIILTITGCLSLAIGWVSAMQIKYTSPVAHHLSINAKSVMQTVLAVLFYKETKTVFWWLGNFLVVAGVLLYAITKIHEDSQKSKKPIIPVAHTNGFVKPEQNKA